MEDYLFQKFNTVVWKTAKKKERKEMSTKTMMQSEKKMGVRAVVQIGMLAAVAVILMLFEIPLPFAPSFYKIDFSEVPVLVGCFAMGPVAGALIELVKILLNFVLTGTSTAGVGEIANFVIGCALCVPAGIIYRRNRTRKNSTDRNGNRNDPDDGSWMLCQCVCSSSGIWSCFRNAGQ